MPMQDPQEPRLSIVTFNLLAPCYKRLFNPDGAERRDREHQHPSLWNARLDNLLHLLTNLSPVPDIIALQEVWFNPGFRNRLEDALKPTFHVFYAKRPGSKEDGLATFVRRSSPALCPDATPALVGAFPLASSDRVGLAVSLTLASGAHLLVVNAHLTFPHCVLNRCMRVEQAEALIRFVSERETLRGFALILGDFNGDGDSRVCKRLIAAGFKNCYATVNGSTAHPATHLNHMKQQVFVDHIFLRPTSGARQDDAVAATRRRRRISALEEDTHLGAAAPARRTSPVTIRDVNRRCTDQHHVNSDMRPVRTVVYPEDFPTNVWPSNYNMSDHRPVGIQFICEVSQ